MLKKNKAQSTLEYITVFSAIVAAIVVLAYSKLKPAVESILDQSVVKITTATSDFAETTVNLPITPAESGAPAEIKEEDKI